MQNKQKTVEEYLEFLNDEDLIGELNPLGIQEYIEIHYTKLPKKDSHDFIIELIRNLIKKYQIDDKTIVEIIYDMEQKNNSGFFKEK